MLVSCLPGCEDKTHKLRKTNIICHTHLVTKTTETLLSMFGLFRRATPSKLFTRQKKKTALSHHLTRFCIRTSSSFLCVCTVFKQTVFHFSPAGFHQTTRKLRLHVAAMEGFIRRFPPRRLDTRQPARTLPAVLAHKHWQVRSPHVLVPASSFGLFIYLR